MQGTGIQLTLLVGPTVAVPAPALLTQAWQSVEVSRSASSAAGFQIVFELVNRPVAEGLAQKRAAARLLVAFNRIIFMATIGGRPHVLVDGIITHRQLQPGEHGGAAKLTITGEDLSFVMDREEKARTHPGQDATTIVTKLIAEYAHYGLVPMVVPPSYVNVPNPVESIPSQNGTDLEYIEHLAEQFGHVFYIAPGPVPGGNTAYWGPPRRSGPPQPALTVGAGEQANVASLHFTHDATRPTQVRGEIIDSRTNTQVAVPALQSLRPPLSARPPWQQGADQMATRVVSISGANLTEALGRAQGIVDRSMDAAVKASGTLDVSRYGHLLQPDGLVGVRGADYGYDGLYYVDSVKHSVKRGEFKQDFELSREGEGSSVGRLPA